MFPNHPTNKPLSMFVDEKILTVQAGKGGDGATLFRHEKYVPKGGPDGGDGGRGGDVVVVGKNNLNTLTDFAHIDRIHAQDGEIGGHQRSSGKSGKTALIAVPLGTVIYAQNENDSSWNQLLEVLAENQPIVLAQGGNGGWGNWHFRSSTNQAPQRANPGQAGERKIIKLVLKLIADIGLVGFPNSGKSTLLSVVSSARPKIANYPFTTLEPQLGIASVGQAKDQRHLVIADLPGLIEGASQGKGLGDTFLRHVERTKTLLHCIEAQLPIEEIIEHYTIIRAELSNWSNELSQKPEMVLLTKTDLLAPEEVQSKITTLTSWLTKNTSTPPLVRCVSAVTHQGIPELLTDLLTMV